MALPSDSVIKAFGATPTDHPESLAGGDETSVVVGETVFKLVDDPALELPRSDPFESRPFHLQYALYGRTPGRGG